MSDAIITSYPMGDGLGFIELIDHMGTDLTIVNAARVSYSKRSEVMDLKAIKLIDYLMRNEHGSPFEHVVFQFRVRAPLYVVQQWERHRIASYNEESGRYIELRTDFAIPLSAEHENIYKDAYDGGCRDLSVVARPRGDKGKSAGGTALGALQGILRDHER